MILRVKNVTKDFPIKSGFLSKEKGFKRAVNNVSFDVKEGEHFCLVGESGSGKTTVARMIMRLYSCTNGQIEFNNQIIDALPKRSYAHQIQMVFQDPYSSLDPRFTIREVLNESMLHQKIAKSDRILMMIDVLEKVGLSKDVLTRYPHEFSGGERQRIAIARALLFDPKILVLDEAISSLDVLVQKQIMDLLQDLQEKFNLTYISISHNLKMVRRYCDRIAVMKDGCIVELGDQKDIFDAPKKKYTQQLLDAALHYRLPE